MKLKVVTNMRMKCCELKLNEILGKLKSDIQQHLQELDSSKFIQSIILCQRSLQNVFCFDQSANSFL